MSNVFLIDHFAHLYRALTHILGSRTPSRLLILPYSAGVYTEMCRLRPLLTAHDLIEDVTVAKVDRSTVHTLRNLRTLRRVVRDIDHEDVLTICNWPGNGLELRQGLAFARAGSVRLAEDAAMMSGIPSQGWLKRTVLRLLFAVDPAYSLSDKISAVYVTNPSTVGNAFRPAAQHIEDFSSKHLVGSDDRVWLREVFGLSPQDVDGDEATIILTQPLADDIAGVSEAEQIEIYASILERCRGVVTLKKHPRDRVIYPFEDSVKQIRQYVPQEFLTDEGFRFDTAVGLFSNAVYATNASERINLFPPGVAGWDLDAVMRSIRAWSPTWRLGCS